MNNNVNFDCNCNFNFDFNSPFYIGNVKIKNRVLLAPLASVADRAFREICREFGAGLSCSEMISSSGVHYGSDKSLEIDDHGPIESPFAVQVFGCIPEIVAEGALAFEKRGAQIIDINMGCPVKKITSNGEGSALMKNVKLAAEIASAVVKSVSVPVTVKIRRGYNSDCENAPELAAALEEAGVSAIAVHGRFKDQLYSGKSDRAVIRKVKDAVKIPVIGNGDILSSSDAFSMVSDTGCDAVMIGRGALGNPWIFREILSCGNGSIPYANRFIKTAHPTEVFSVLRDQYLREIEYKGEYTAVREMRTHIFWYLKGFRDNTTLKDAICHETESAGVLALLEEYFTKL